MPPPVLVANWMASDIQLNSPASETTDSPGCSEISSTGIVVPWMVSSIVGVPPRLVFPLGSMLLFGSVLLFRSA